MSFPDGAEYWHDVKRHFSRSRPEPKAHAPAPGVSLVLASWEDSRSAERGTLCGLTIRRDNVRSKKSRVTCRNCLALLCRFVVSHEVDGVRKVLLATDDALQAQEKFYEAKANGLVDITLQDRQAP